MGIMSTKTSMISFAVLAVLVTLAGGGCLSNGGRTDLPSAQGEYFSLSVGGDIIGYSTCRLVGTQSYRGAEVLHVESYTLIKVNLPSGETTSEYRATTYLYQDLHPAYYRLQLTADGEERTIEMEGIGDRGKFHYIADGNVFDHFLYLFLALGLERGQSREVSLLIPQVSEAEEVVARFTAGDVLKEIAILDKVYRYFDVEVDVGGLQTLTCQVTEEGRLIGMLGQDEQFVLQISDSQVVGRVKGIDMMKLLEPKFCAANVSFSFMTNVTYMRADVEVSVAAEKIQPDFLDNTMQRFEGTAEQNVIKGVFETRAERFNGRASYRLPAEFSADLAPFLESEVKVESDDLSIVKQAFEIAGGENDPWEAARSVSDWVYRHLRYEITATGAKQALVDRKGDCGPHAYLVIAMSRSLGIPTRLVGGFMYSAGRFGQHYWVEHYMGDAGWIPSDPTVGEYGWIDATHVRLFQSGAIATLDRVKVLDYTDEGIALSAERRLKPLLEVGFGGEYIFFKGETEFGRNTYEVIGEEVQNGAVVFTLRSNLQLDLAKLGAGGTLALEADLTVDDAANPRFYTVDAMAAGQKQTVRCSVENGVAQDVVVVGEKQYQKELTLDENTILLDNNMIGWFDLMYSTLPLKPGETFHVPVLFPGNLLTMLVTLTVREEPEEIQVGNNRQAVYVCDVPAFKQIDYVTFEGVLVRIEIPTQDVVIVRQD